MSEPIETQLNASLNAQAQNGYATQPSAFRPSAPISSPPPHAAGVNSTSQLAGSWAMKPYVFGAVVAALVLVLVYQQTQISHMAKDLSLINDHLKSSDVRDRLDAHDAKLAEINSRLTYLDSKIGATDEKAAAALAKLKAQEDNDFFGNAIKSIKHTFGIQ